MRALDETGDIPSASKLRGEVPDRADRDHAPAGLRPQARAAALRRARASTRSTRCAPRPRTQQIRELRGLRRQGRGERCSQTLGRATPTGRPGAADPAARARCDVAEQIVGALRAHPAADRVEVAGSLRRLADSVKDLDIIATADDPAALVAALGRARRSSSRSPPPGDAGARVTHAHGHEGRPARSSSPTSSATCCSTSPAPRRTTWRCARRRCGAGCTSPSTGSSTTRPARRCAARPRRRSTSGSGCAWIPPELREGRGELEAARRRATLPELIDARATCAATCTATRRCRDGRQTLEEMAEAARERGLRVPRDHRPLGLARVRQPRHARRAARADRARSARSTSALDGIRAADRAPRPTSSPTARSTTTTSCSAQLDWVIALGPHLVRRWASRR